MIDFKKLDLMDSLDLAILIEEEACERYEAFAEQVGSSYEGDAGVFFSTMAVNEAKHGTALKARRKELFQDAPSRVTGAMVWDIEAPESGYPRPYMSPRQAMKLALASETKAYDFFNEALKYIENVEVKALFIELREEEAEHKNELIRQIALLPPGGEGPDGDADSMDEPPAL